MKPSELYNRVLNITLVEATLGDEDEIRGRRADIASNPRFVNRLGTMVVHRAVHTVGARRVLAMNELFYRNTGYEVLGHGYNSTVIREPGADNVRKIIRGSDRLSDDERIELMKSIKGQIAVSETFLSDIAVPTVVTIGTSPVRETPIVEIVQPFVSASAEKPDPNEIRHFAERGLDEMMPNGYLPDVAGRQNVVNTDNGIRLIDTVPISVDNVRTFGRCAKRLYEMAATGS